MSPTLAHDTQNDYVLAVVRGMFFRHEVFDEVKPTLTCVRRRTRWHPRTTIRSKLSKEQNRTYEPSYYRSSQPLQAKCSTALTALAVHQGDKQTRRLSLASLPSFSLPVILLHLCIDCLSRTAKHRLPCALNEISVSLAPRRWQYGTISLSLPRLRCSSASTSLSVSLSPLPLSLFTAQCCRHTLSTHYCIEDHLHPVTWRSRFSDILRIER